MSKRYTAYATAKVTVEFTVKDIGTWHDTCTIGQADHQARESALAQIHRHLKDVPGCKVVKTDVEVYVKEGP